ncbi:MAG: prepilin-type N-terminal cleavage/methylation domain-containing protein [Candidatus Omnitrophica bacterium]|nr:prepilin-type N-terminal cleavage/methylation domain-containing protein [Candidatus Omnitrophota bacterium]MCM8816318.1 prepilin-type N-terminal cleavage/methylation domain-containing protein [Candidatus Omnitrophota bacterium]
MRIKGFTLTEIAAVAAIVSTLSLGGYQLVKKGKDSVCINNLKQIGQAIAMFEADHDSLPEAVFYPRDANDPRGIHSLLKKYGASPQLFFCPALSAEFNKYGTNYIWNEAASKRKEASNASRTWLMTEITSLYPELPTPHTGGYGILYADGHTAFGRDIGFPPFERPVLASNISIEREKEEKTLEKKEDVFETKVSTELGSYQIFNIPKVAQAGKPISITIKAVDREGKIYESDEKLKIIDFTGSVEPNEIHLQKGIANAMILFKKSHAANTLIVIDSKGRWNASNEFTVEPAQVSSLEIFPPTHIYAGIVANFKIVFKDLYGNPILKDGIKISIRTDVDAEYSSEVVSSAEKDTVVPIIFKKAGETRVSFSVSGTLIKESLSVVVRPGPLEKFEISQIKSPIEAGTPVSITVKALDKYGNRTKGFLISQDAYNPKYVQEDMSSGIWMETITFEKAVSETFIEISDGMGHTGRSNTFSVVPSQPSRIKLISDNLIAIQEHEFGIEFSVFDRFGNVISGLESKLMVEDGTDGKITTLGDHYLLTLNFKEPGRKKIRIYLSDRRETVFLDFYVEVLPKKPVLKKEGM